MSAPDVPRTLTNRYQCHGNDGNYFCTTDFWGMCSADVPGVACVHTHMMDYHDGTVKPTMDVDLYDPVSNSTFSIGEPMSRLPMREGGGVGHWADNKQYTFPKDDNEFGLKTLTFANFHPVR